jgi:hypothetical protein
MTIRLGDLERNDVDAALAFAEQEIRARGALLPGDSHVLAMLQDDPSELIRRVVELERRLGTAPDPES